MPLQTIITPLLLGEKTENIIGAVLTGRKNT